MVLCLVVSALVPVVAAGPDDDVTAATRAWAAAYDSRDRQNPGALRSGRGVLGHVVADVTGYARTHR